MRNIRALMACEESQEVCIAFREHGVEAYSCDLQECSGGHPEWHIQADALSLVNGHDAWFAPFPLFRTQDGKYHSLPNRWDIIIAFPPCTYMTNAGAVRMYKGGELQEDRFQKAMEAKEFFMAFYNADCPRICIENPTPMKVVELPPYTQAIQPYHFGHEYSKRTCIWLKGLPPLMATCIMEHHVPYVNGGCKDAHGTYRRLQGRKERDPKSRSKTFPGIAKAMADQWCAFMEGQK